jgi:hypothetical protein
VCLFHTGLQLLSLLTALLKQSTVQPVTVTSIVVRAHTIAYDFHNRLKMKLNIVLSSRLLNNAMLTQLTAYFVYMQQTQQDCKNENLTHTLMQYTINVK